MSFVNNVAQFFTVNDFPRNPKINNGLKIFLVFDGIFTDQTCNSCSPGINIYLLKNIGLLPATVADDSNLLRSPHDISSNDSDA